MSEIIISAIIGASFGIVVGWALWGPRNDGTYTKYKEPQ